MHSRTILQLLIILVSGTCSVMIARSYVNGERQIQMNRENQPIYRETLSAEQEMPPLPRPGFSEFAFDRGLL